MYLLYNFLITLYYNTIYNKTVNSEFKVMNKFFITICFSLFLPMFAYAGITPINNYKGNLQPSQHNTTPTVKVVDYDDFASFVREAIKKAKFASKEDMKGNTTSYVPSVERQKQENENKKSIFEKIYDQAMRRASSSTNITRSDVAVNSIQKLQPTKIQQQQWQNPKVSTITVKMLPNNAPTAIPALEHIPYCMSSIEILNDGLVKIVETVMVVANGEKLKYGLTKILPAKVYNGKGKMQTLDYSIVSVLRNDQPEDYRLVAQGDDVFLIPYDDSPLAPGVYTYQFEYLVDNLLIDKGDSYMLYWDVGGHGWNLVIDRLGAVLNLPERKGLLQHNVLFGNENNLYSGGVMVGQYGPAGMAYVAQNPLFVGEGMYLLALIDKSVMLPVGLWQKFMRSFYDFGDIYLSIIGCLFIAVSLIISWRYIKSQKKIEKFKWSKTAIIMRWLFKDKFDITAACGFLLELYKKNIIDIQQADDTILLIKRTDNLKSFTPFEQRAVSRLFPAHEMIFNVETKTRLAFTRFMKDLKSGLKREINKFNFKLCVGYIAISFAMLFLTEAFIAYFKISSGLTFTVLAIATLVSGVFLLLWNIHLPAWLKVIWRFFIIDICLLALFFMIGVVNIIAAIVLLISEIIIVTAIRFFARRSGLLSYYIKDLKDYRDNLLKNIDNITLGKNFINYQASIWVLDLSDDIVPLKEEEYYKIPIVKNIIRLFS